MQSQVCGRPYLTAGTVQIRTAHELLFPRDFFFLMCLFLPPFVHLIEKVYKKMYIIDTDSNFLLECELQ